MKAVRRIIDQRIESEKKRLKTEDLPTEVQSIVSMADQYASAQAKKVKELSQQLKRALKSPGLLNDQKEALEVLADQFEVAFQCFNAVETTVVDLTAGDGGDLGPDEDDVSI